MTSRSGVVTNPSQETDPEHAKRHWFRDTANRAYDVRDGRTRYLDNHRQNIFGIHQD